MEQEKKCSIRSSLFISFFMSAVCYIIIYKCFPMVYAINDDVAMRDIASGAFSGEPDAHLIFIKYVLGILLSGMYRIFPGYDWYGFLMTGLIGLCLGILLYRGLSDIVSRKKKIAYLLAVLVLFICVGLQHLVIFQWTMTAGVTGATGVFLFYTSSEKNKLKNILEEITAVILLILTFCIRSDVLFMVVPAAAICYLFKYVKISRRGRRKFHIQHVWFWILLIGGCTVVIFIEKSAYRSEEWKKYQAFNNSRSEVYDFYGIPDFEENQDFYKSIDMGEPEVQALENYSLFLIDGIYEYKMEEIAEYAKDRVEKDGIIKRLGKGMQGIYADFKLDIYAPLSWLAAAVCIFAVLLCWRRKSRQFYLLFACMGIQLLLWCYLGLQGRIVERVSFSMHFYMLLLAGAILYKEFMEGRAWDSGIWVWTRESNFLVSSLVIVLVVVALLEWDEVKQEALQKVERNQENVELCNYLEEHKENVYLMHTYSTSHYTDNFKIRKPAEFSNIVSLGDWQSFSPIEIRKREVLGILNARDALYTQENVYAVSRFDMTYVDECLQKAYGSCYSQDADVVAFRNYLYWIKRYKEL